MATRRPRRLNETEGRVLAAAEQNADAPISVIAKRAKTKVHTAQYILNRLKDSGTIYLRPLINLIASGRSCFVVYFSISDHNRKKRTALIEAIKRDPQVVWFAEIGGEFQYTLSLWVTDIYAIEKFFESISKEHLATFFSKSMAIQYCTLHCGRGYLTNDKKPRIGMETRYNEKVNDFKLDDTDKKILGEMSGRGFVSRRALAQKLKLPLSTVDLRIRKLQDAEIIAGYVYEVIASKIGVQCFILLIYAKGIAAALYDRLKTFSLQNPYITHLCACLGAWDFELHIEVTEPGQVSQLQQELYDLFETSISTIKVFSNYSNIKFSQLPYVSE